MLLQKGLTTDTSSFETIGPLSEQDLQQKTIEGREVIPPTGGWISTAGEEQAFIRFVPKDGRAGYDIFLQLSPVIYALRSPQSCFPTLET